MRKIWVIAVREYLAAVRTKTFVIGLLMMPILMGGSALLQYLFKDMVDVRDKNFVVVDRIGNKGLTDSILQFMDVHNKTLTVDVSTGKQTKPRLVVLAEEPAGTSQDEIDRQRFQLSERVRKGELVGFLEILQNSKSPNQVKLRYQTNRPTFMEFPIIAETTAAEFLRKKTAEKLNIPSESIQALSKPTSLENKGLTNRDEATGAITDSPDQSRFASIIVPMVAMIFMFMLVLMGATPLMQGVVEEKTARIAEVLLGSARPFEIMMGKLLGMVAVTLTVSAVYLSGAIWAAQRFEVAEYITVDFVLWFILFQSLAALMFGSLFIAIGAACTEMRETQNLMWPVMLLACLPMFLIGTVIRDPHGPVVRGFSFFPFATPSLMIGRISAPPGLPLWEPLLAVALVLVTTVFCVYCAGRIFRVGILLQGKGANLKEMFRWVIRG
ncbi:MAG: ABC transporter permease [Gemmataceae bacterium]|nr:ABC transporter permease [Gemmataceae bacterium]MCI0740272.1 ABC transporter permease [Gemmataceae bacterium]